MSATLPIEETLRFLERHLPQSPSRVLEVGCGAGDVALALAARGYDVTGLDAALSVPTTTAQAEGARIRWIEADFLFYEESNPYDAVLFTRSLHHMAPVSKASPACGRRPTGSNARFTICSASSFKIIRTCDASCCRRTGTGIL